MEADAKVNRVLERLRDREAIAAALARASREALLMHARLGHAASVSRDGRIVFLTPDEIFAMFPDAERR